MNQSNCDRLAQLSPSPTQEPLTRWVLFQITPGSELDQAIQLIINTDTMRGDVLGLHYADDRTAESLSEALAEFATNGGCQGSLRLRLIIQAEMKTP